MPNHNLALAYQPPQSATPVADDNESLVHRIRGGDPGAEHTLATRFQPQITMVGRQLGADSTVCDDLVQETLLKVLLNLRDGRLKDPKKLSAYIHQTARFTYYRWLQNKHSQLELRESCDDARHSSEVEREFLQASDRLWLAEQISKLRMERDQQILIRFYFDHQEKCEVCDEMDLSFDQFDKLIWRARTRLKKVVHD